MNFYTISGLISFIINLGIAIAVYFKNPRSPTNRYFAMFSLAVSGWSVGSFLANAIADKQLALVVLRYNYLFAVWLPAFYLHYIYSYIGTIHLKHRLIKIAYSISLVLTPFVFTRWFIKGFRIISPADFYISLPGPVYYIFAVFFTLCTLELLLGLYLKMRQSSGLQRLRLKYLTLANIIAIVAGFEYFSRVFNIFKSPPIDDYILVIYFCVLAYAIAKYHLMDIAILTIRATIFFLVYAALLFLPLFTFFAYRDGADKMGIGAYAFLVSLAPFLYFFFTNKAESRILAQKRLRQDRIRRLSSYMMRFNRLEVLSSLIVHNVLKIFRLNHCAIYVLESNPDRPKQFNLICSYSIPQKIDMPLNISTASVLIKWLTKDRTAIEYEFVKHNTVSSI